MAPAAVRARRMGGWGACGPPEFPCTPCPARSLPRGQGDGPSQERLTVDPAKTRAGGTANHRRFPHGGTAPVSPRGLWLSLLCRLLTSSWADRGFCCRWPLPRQWEGRVGVLGHPRADSRWVRADAGRVGDGVSGALSCLLPLPTMGKFSTTGCQARGGGGRGRALAPEVLSLLHAGCFLFSLMNNWTCLKKIRIYLVCKH